jgi:hypothetical protein
VTEQAVYLGDWKSKRGETDLEFSQLLRAQCIERRRISDRQQIGHVEHRLTPSSFGQFRTNPGASQPRAVWLSLMTKR